MQVKILNFGSLNIDNVYHMTHFVAPGETEASLSYERYAGGKGCNQSLAVAKAGLKIAHAGKVGFDGVWLRDLLSNNKVDTTFVEVVDEPSGHAIIQVDKSGENSIILHAGANSKIDDELVNKALGELKANDILLLQNEINAVSKILTIANEKKLKVFFNPAPMTDDIKQLDLSQVDHFFINLVEGMQFTGYQDPDAILTNMQKKFPKATIVLTLSEDGVVARTSHEEVRQCAFPVTCCDTTGAGDTFIGFYLAEYAKGSGLAKRLEIAAKAAAICVSRRGTAESIPTYDEVQKFGYLNER